MLVRVQCMFPNGVLSITFYAKIKPWQYVCTVIFFSNKLFHVRVVHVSPIQRKLGVLIACGTIKPIVLIFHELITIRHASNTCVGIPLQRVTTKYLVCMRLVPFDIQQSNIVHSNYKLIYIWMQACRGSATPLQLKYCFFCMKKLKELPINKQTTQFSSHQRNNKQKRWRKKYAQIRRKTLEFRRFSGSSHYLCFCWFVLFVICMPIANSWYLDSN